MDILSVLLIFLISQWKHLLLIFYSYFHSRIVYFLNVFYTISVHFDTISKICNDWLNICCTCFSITDYWLTWFKQLFNCLLMDTFSFYMLDMHDMLSFFLNVKINNFTIIITNTMIPFIKHHQSPGVYIRYIY